MRRDEDELSTMEIAELAGVDRRTVLRWCETRELTAYRYGARGRWRIKRADWITFAGRSNQGESSEGKDGAPAV